MPQDPPIRPTPLSGSRGLEDSSIVCLDGVTCRYRRSQEPALIAVDLSVGRGDFVGIVGPSGSGKTTLLRVLLGTMPATAGPSEGRVIRTPGVRIGYVPQVETVDWNFPVTVAEVVLMARPRSGRRLVPWATRAEKVEVADVLDRLGLGGLADRHIRELSGGQQQRVFIARALLRQPQLLVMDEPTAGVDVGTRHEVLHLLADLHRDGLSIVLTTHDLNGLAAHLPRIVCLRQRIVADGHPAEVLTPEVLEHTYGAPMEVLIHGGMPVVVDTLPASAVPNRQPSETGLQQQLEVGARRRRGAGARQRPGAIDSPFEETR